MCNLCKTQSVYEFTNKRTLCKTCFIRWFEKKVFYTIKKFSMINRGDKICCEIKKDFRNVVLVDVLKFYCSKSGNILVTSGKNYNKIALANNLDLNSFEFIEDLRSNGLKSLKRLSPIARKKIYPLYLFLDKEILIYAELKKLKYKKEILKKAPPTTTQLISGKFNPTKPTPDQLTTSLEFFRQPREVARPPLKTNLKTNLLEISHHNSWINFINELEKKHPEIKNAIMNSYLKIID